MIPVHIAHGATSIVLAEGVNQIMVFDTAQVLVTTSGVSLKHVDLYVRLAAGAQLSLDCLVHTTEIQQLNIHIHLEARSFLTQRLNLRFSTIKQSSITLVLERAAQADIQGRYQLSGSNQVTAQLRVEHVEPTTYSNVQFKGVLNDDARWNLQGMLHIGESAQGAQASLYDQSLLFGQARAVSIPSLEALNNDISCRHGSAIGMIDQESLQYLMMRGLAPEVAQNLIVEMFLY